MNEEIKKIFSALSSEKHYVPGTISTITSDRDILNVTAGQNANWTYANFFILPEKSAIKNFSINEGQFVVLCNNGIWYIYDYEGKPVAQGFEEIKAFVEKISKAEEIRLKFLGKVKSSHNCQSDDTPRQVIFYGAPGTGKSYTVKKETDRNNSVRTTFHPDTDYASFVGAYKPVPKPVNSSYIDTGRDEEITYKFSPQVFLKAYVKAWKQYVENHDEPKPFYLVIEEINRGNCAQIFGDLFQLLDREDSGASSYEIEPDNDLTKFLNEDKEWGFANVDTCGDFDDNIKAGKILKLPSNFFIYATMNTSDQSLFPIDSAFKRRWDWRYTPIAKPAEKNWTIEANGKTWSWWEFLKRINFEIGNATESEDKKLGYFFVRAKKTDPADVDNNHGVINAQTFVSKVLFYLWNDVIKDNDFNTERLKDPKDKLLDFIRFFKFENGESVVDEALVEHFINNIMQVKLPDEPETATAAPTAAPTDDDIDQA